MNHPLLRAAGLLLVALASIPSIAAGGDRLTVTGGATGFEGQAGGGLVPWALIAGHGSDSQLGGSAFATRAELDDYRLEAFGAAAAIGDRLELSVARQALTVKPLDLTLEQDVLGAKVRLFGRAPYTRRPQVVAGLQYKRNRDFEGLPSALGAQDDSDVDLWLGASKLFFSALAGRNVLTNVTVRSTRARETGFLGFAGDRRLLIEASAGVFLSDRLLVGAEYRQKPEGLPGVQESDWSDLFVAWFPARHVSVTAARLSLDDVVIFEDQRGWYLSLELTL